MDRAWRAVWRAIAGRAEADWREAIREEAEGADTDEPFRKHVQEEPAQKLRRLKCHLALFSSMRIVFPAEGHALSIKRQQPVIGDGHAMRVAAQIAEYLRGAG